MNRNFERKTVDCVFDFRHSLTTTEYYITYEPVHAEMTKRNLFLRRLLRSRTIKFWRDICLLLYK
jgi:hypothetical protein